MSDDRDFVPEPERSIPMSKSYDPVKEGMSVGDPDPIETGIKKRHEEIRSMKSIGDFMALRGSKLLKVALDTKIPPLGRHIEIAPSILSEEPVFPSSSLGCKTKVEISGGKSNASPATKLAEIQKRLDEPVKESQAPRVEETKPGISIERLVFLERVEKIMASEARIKEIEAENKTLVGMVSRLNKELDELKAKLSKNL